MLSLQTAYQANYEPWFILLRRHSLPYDARFRGYGWNKVAQVCGSSHRGMDTSGSPIL